MTEPTEAARQRCADLCNEIRPGSWYATDFSEAAHSTTAKVLVNHVQDTHDKASEILRLLLTQPRTRDDALDTEKALLALARSMMLPEPKDELVEALHFACEEQGLGTGYTPGELAKHFRAHFAKQGLELIIRKVGE